MSEKEKMSITAVVLTLNESRHIARCLGTLDWADARIVWDSYSTDDTVAIARNTGAIVVENSFENYAQQRNAALEWVAKNQSGGTALAEERGVTGLQRSPNWVFFVDADERIPNALANELREVTESVTHTVWAVPRHNYLFGKLTLGAGWYPDYQARLFLVGSSRFDPLRTVHEVAVFDGSMGLLTHTLEHSNYENLVQFNVKQRKYSEFEARIMHAAGTHPKARNFLLQPMREFFRRYIGLKGYRDGIHGLRLSALMAYYNFDMYRRLARMWKTNKDDR